MSSYKRVNSGNIVKIGSIKLPPDPTMWTDRIYEHIAQTHPYLVDHLQGGIDWSEEPIDEDTGDGIGHITALIGEKPIQIPIIVRDYKLSPIDLYITSKGDMDLLNKDMATKRFNPQNVRVGNSIDPNLQYDREGALNSWLGKVGAYSGFAEDCERVFPELEKEYPGMSEGITRITKSAHNHSSSPDEDTLVVQEIGGSGYRITSFSTGEKIATQSIRRGSAYENPNSILAKAARKADETGNAIIINRPLDKKAMTALSEGATKGDSPSKMDAGDTASLLTDSGDRVGGVMMRRVTLDEPEAKAKNGSMIFLSQNGDNGAYSTSPRMLKAGDGQALSMTQTKDIIDAKRNEKGFIAVPQIGDKAAALSGPVRIKQRLTNEHGERVVRVDSITDGSARLVLSDRVNRILPLERKKHKANRYTVPTDLKFVQAEKELIPASSSPEEVLNEKVAESDDLGIVSIAESRGSFLCRAENQEESLMQKEAQAWLMSLGCQEKSAQELTKKAREENSRITIYGLESPISSLRGQRHVPPEAEEKIATFIDTWTKEKESINKFAAQLPNGNVLQSQMASMNLMSQYNAPHYAEALEEIKDAKTSVANLLYQSRVEKNEIINEEVSKDALVALDDIIKGLKQIQATT